MGPLPTGHSAVEVVARMDEYFALLATTGNPRQRQLLIQKALREGCLLMTRLHRHMRGYIESLLKEGDLWKQEDAAIALTLRDRVVEDRVAIADDLSPPLPLEILRSPGAFREFLSACQNIVLETGISREHFDRFAAEAMQHYNAVLDQ